MKKIISYALFGNESRYWASIPFILIANDLIYSDYISRFYISKDATENKLFKLFEEIILQTKKVEIEVINDKYIGTEPTMWRMKPLWDKSVELFICRDIDAVPRSDERRATLLFEQSPYAIHGIRSYWTHSTRLMAGLCGFKTAKVRRAISSYKNYEMYKMFGKKYVRDYCTEYQWGCDQHILQRFFFMGRHGQFLLRQTLDTLVGSAGIIPWFRAVRLPTEKYANISLDHINTEILQLCDSLVAYVGLPLTVENRHLRQALKIDCEMSNILKKIFADNKEIAEHYQIEVE